MKSVELFAGAGGLAMGITLAGFESAAVVEWDKWACDTIRQNQERDFPLVRHWPLWQGDVRAFDWGALSDIDLVAGGPPCQPFSLGGKHKAYGDERDMFPATVEVIRTLRPKAFIIENVKGLTRSSFANYYQYILLQLEFPEIVRAEREKWFEHLQRLQREHTAGIEHQHALTYNVVPTLVNAADYGVPQRRERVFIVGFRSDLGITWAFPKPTHSLEALLHAQWIDGSYWDEHAVPRSRRPEAPERFQAILRRLSDRLLPMDDARWRTVRDALLGVPHPRKDYSSRFFNHAFQGGAKPYPGHTGSPLDFPAKTLKAGDHGVPGGENMLVDELGATRYFSVRESARLQTFPDGYVFHGSWTETMRQLGNAVPVALARKVAASVAEQLALHELSTISLSSSRNVA